MRIFLAGACAGLLLAAACGDDDATSSTTGSGSGGATGSSSSATTTASTTTAVTTGGEECEVERVPADDAAPAPIFTPRWALRPWISKDISDGPDTYAFVDGFLERDIPVSVVVLDSPWETNYNTFEPNPERYPEFGQMVADLRDRGVRVVLWTTQFMNLSSLDAEPGGDFYDGPAEGYERAEACNWYVNEGEISFWWKGRGAAIDFFDPDACAFFHRLQDRVLDLGVAGWKLDFGDQYVATAPMTTDGGTKTRQEYSEAYYEDFYAYGAAKLGTDEFVTMVRPYDRSYNFEGRFYARPEHAPVTWVGDNRRDDIGLADALDHVFRSARAGYAVIGSDIGGYLDLDDEDLLGDQIPLDAHNFQRWTAMSIFMPFFQLHGRANLTPWTFPDVAEEVTATYRASALLHDALVPFFDALVRAAYAGGAMPLRPIGDEEDWPDDYRFTLGDAILVAPALTGAAEREVELPEGRVYRDLWDLSAPPIEGGATIVVDTTDPARVPAFVLDGAIVPALAHPDTPVIGDAALEGLVQLLVVPGRDAELPLWAEDGTESAVAMTDDGSSVVLSLSAVTEPTVLRVRLDGAGATVDADVDLVEAADRGALADDEDAFFVDEVAGEILVRLAVREDPVEVTINR